MERGILDRSEIERILLHAGPRAAGSRLRAAVAVMYRTGMRPGELLSLRMVDLRRDERGRLIARIVRPKGHAKIKNPSPPREVMIDERAASYLKDWLGYRGSEPGHVFCNRRGEPMTRQALGRDLANAARRAGIEKRCHLHGIRHSMAHDYYFEQLDVGALAGILGHRKVSTTWIYLQNIGCAPRVISSMERRAEW